MVRTALLTVSDLAVTGAGDPVAAAVREVLARGPFVEVDYAAVPEQQARVRAQLRVWADGGRTDLILTAGGIGLAPRDRTPEATRDVLDRELPGLAERMRQEGARVRATAMLGRGVAGVRRTAVVVNLPGTPAAAADALAAILPVLPDAVAALRPDDDEGDLDPADG